MAGGISKNGDLTSLNMGHLQWDSPDAAFDSLNKVYDAALAKANEAHDWYIANRRSLKIAGQWLRALTVVFGVAGGIVPLLPDDFDIHPEWGYVLIALAGGCLLFNHVLGVFET